jgi:glutamine amidotransferase
MITIANVGLGNFASVANMYKFLEIDVQVVDSPDAIPEVTHLILPGVGAFDPGMRLLETSGWKDAILNLRPGTKLLGICLGMHLLTNGSEEGTLPGLGMIDATCRRFDDKNLKVPHIGWNEVVSKVDNSLLSKEESRYFYFSHSYFVECKNREVVQASTKYGQDFTSYFNQGDIHGVQFHPEKSHRYGMDLLRKFASS